MKNYYLTLYLIVVFLLILSINVKGMIFQCENGYSYKIDIIKKDISKVYFKTLDEDWKIVENVNITDKEYELFIPNSTYLSCSNKNLSICNFSTLITNNPSLGEINVREVVLNNCYIGTMGCNQYYRGMQLNQRRCKLLTK